MSASLLPLISAISIFFLTVFILFAGYKVKINLFFSLFAFLIMAWLVGSYFLFSSCDTINDAIFLDRLIYVFVVFIPSAVYHFSVVFMGKKDKNIYIILNYILSFIFLGLSRNKLFLNELFIYKYGCHAIAGPLHNFFIIFFGAVLISMFFILYKFYYSTNDKIKKIQTLYISTAFFILATIGSLAFLPAYRISIHPIVYFSGFIVSIILAYAILKHQLFNIKVIATELLVFMLWIFLSINIFLDENWWNRLIDGIILALAIIFGILIIKSVLKEVSQKEKFEKFNQELESLNDKLRTKTLYLTALQDFTTDITQSLDYKIIIQKIVDEIPDRLGYISALLFLISENGDKISLSAISSNQATRIGLRILPKPASEYFAKMKEDKILVIEAVNKNSIQISERFSDFIAPPVPKLAVDLIQKTVGIKSAVGIPVKSGEKIVGTIVILSNKEKENISQDELEMIQALANQVGIVLKNVSLYEQIKQVNEKLVEIDKMKAGMYSFVSHQIKAPIGIVKGFAQLISEGSYGKIPKKVKETVDNIKKSADRLIQLVEDFLDLRRIEEGKMDFRFNDVDIVGLIRSVVEELKLLAEQKGLKLSFNIGTSDVQRTSDVKKIIVKADEQRMRQVIQNLIENAIKYTEKGFVSVKCQMSEVKGQNQNEVLITVSDSGMGIKPEVLSELFDQFTRAKEARAIKGTGLGLYIAREIVKAHQGEIWAESEGENNGSRFFVRLPIGI